MKPQKKERDRYNPYRLEKNEGKVPRRYRKPKGKRKP